MSNVNAYYSLHIEIWCYSVMIAYYWNTSAKLLKVPLLTASIALLMVAFFNFELQKQQAFHNGWDAQDYQRHPHKCPTGVRHRFIACDKLQDCSWAVLWFVLIYIGLQEFSSSAVVNPPEPQVGRIIKKQNRKRYGGDNIYSIQIFWRT